MLGLTAQLALACTGQMMVKKNCPRPLVAEEPIHRPQFLGMIQPVRVREVTCNTIDQCVWPEHMGSGSEGPR